MELKIIYFNFPFWRAEVARIPLYISNTKFEDKRITSEEFSYIKENGKMTDGTIIPFSQLPVLVIDGQSIAQTGAIARICGKISGFYPESLVEAGDKIAQWADENRYDLWHFLSKSAAVTTGESIEEYKDEKTSDADV